MEDPQTDAQARAAAGAFGGARRPSAGRARRTAAFVVARWLLTKEFPANLLPDGPDRAFVQDLVYTVIRRLRPLRHILGTFVKQWPKGELEALLYVGAAQILYMGDVPDFAAVNETVAAAKACENPSVARVVNGVLRNLIRRRDTLSLGTELETFPTALVRRWTARFGAENAERLAAWHNAPAVTYLARRDGTFTQLERGQKVSDVPGFAAGAFIVQDPGTHLAVELLDPQPGERILDACAAPGGKTVQLAWRGADVTACEVNPRRRARLEENLRRLKLADVKVVAGLGNNRIIELSNDRMDEGANNRVVESSNDRMVKGPNNRIVESSNDRIEGGTHSFEKSIIRKIDYSTISSSDNSTIRQFDHSIIPSFDHFSKVLVDAPCSNTGVFRRRPDARWNWSAEKLAELVKLQAEILDAAAAHVAPGGTLVYSTCSNEPEENTAQVEAFLARHPEFTLREAKESVPFETGHDGAFAAALVKCIPESPDVKRQETERD